MIFHWLIPFVLLLWRRTKRNPGALAFVAVWILFMRLVDLLWLLGPSFAMEGAQGHGSYAQADAAARGAHHGGYWHVWMYFAAAAAIGGVWVLAFVWQLKRRPLLPLNDARLVRAAARAAAGGHHG